MENVLRNISEIQIFPNPNNSILNRGISKDFVELALIKKRVSNRPRALDGCPYELWKELNKAYKEAKKLDRPGFDIVGSAYKGCWLLDSSALCLFLEMPP